jgi:hypothetical protein
VTGDRRPSRTREVWVHPLTLDDIRRSLSVPARTRYDTQIGSAYAGIPLYTDCRHNVGTVHDAPSEVGAHRCSASAPCSATRVEKGSSQ